MTGGHTRRDAILATALRLFEERGYASVSTRDICDELSISRSGVYNYFQTKEQILFELQREMLQTRQDELSSVLCSLEGSDSAIKLEGVIRAVLGINLRRRAAWRMINREINSLSGTYRAQVVDMRDRYEKQVRAVYREVTDSLNLSDAEVKLHVFNLFAITRSIPDWYREDGPVSLEDIIEFNVTFLMNALGTQQLARHS
jgi:AcrR family transcriptional regulator